jgi:GDP-mannose 6-dehydrogenase
MPSVSVFGLGYVGSVTAACLASLGNRVIGVDVNPSKVEMLNSGRSPIVEARVDELVAEGKKKGTLSATTSVEEALRDSDISFISVATPSQRNGKLELGSVIRVCEQIGEALRKKSTFHTIVMRSTVLPGTCEETVAPAIERTSGKRCGVDFAVCMNPEFLREGCAVEDFFHPSFTVMGAQDPSQLALLKQLYSFAPENTFETPLKVAEMVKYACNSFHALKVAFANEIGTLCRQLDIDPFAVTKAFLADDKLNVSKAYLTPGFAFGGSCLPKDVRALTYCAKEHDVQLPLLQSVLPSNNEHIERAVQAVLQTGRRRVGVLGLSFKPGTDDLRESPSVVLIKRLLGEGCEVRIWDKDVLLGRLIGSNRQFIEDVIPHIGSLLSEDMEAVIANAEVVVVGTKAVAAGELAKKLRPDQTLVDLLQIEYRPAATVAAT